MNGTADQVDLQLFFSTQVITKEHNVIPWVITPRGTQPFMSKDCINFNPAVTGWVELYL
jgi:hypothetical protein